jgi:TrmH family RNA methyltransferase
MESIASRHNPIARTFRALAHGRADDGLLLDGVRLVEDALASGARIRTAAVSRALLSRAGGADRLVSALEASGARVVAVPPTVMAFMSPVHTPSGLVAIAEPTVASLDAAFAGAPQLTLILEHLQDPGNVGAVVRTADAAGATGVVACGETADPFGWKALRGAMGSTFRLPVVARADTAAAVSAARERGLRVVAATPRGGTPMYDADLTRPVAILMGGEGAGLATGTAALADERVTIPMRAPVESLNVAVSAALILYEACRQRRR